MALLFVTVLVGGAFVIAVVASEAHFGRPRRRSRDS